MSSLNQEIHMAIEDGDTIMNDYDEEFDLHLVATHKGPNGLVINVFHEVNGDELTDVQDHFTLQAIGNDGPFETLHDLRAVELVGKIFELLK